MLHTKNKCAVGLIPPCIGNTYIRINIFFYFPPIPEGWPAKINPPVEFAMPILCVTIHCWDAFQQGEVTQGTIGPVSSPAPVGCPRARDLLVHCDPPIIYGILWWSSG